MWLVEESMRTRQACHCRRQKRVDSHKGFSSFNSNSKAKSLQVERHDTTIFKRFIAVFKKRLNHLDLKKNEKQTVHNDYREWEK